MNLLLKSSLPKKLLPHKVYTHIHNIHNIQTCKIINKNVKHTLLAYVKYFVNVICYKHNIVGLIIKIDRENKYFVLKNYVKI